jgi:hypothetical protein
VTLQTTGADLRRSLAEFVAAVPGVEHALLVSADGLAVATSPGLSRAVIDQFSAITAGLISLTQGASQCFGYEAMDQVIVEMRRGFLFVAAVRDGSCLAVVAGKSCDIAAVGYEMTLLCDRAGELLTDDLIVDLRATLPR